MNPKQIRAFAVGLIASAAFGFARMEQLPTLIERKREPAMQYKDYSVSFRVAFITEAEGCRPNCWLNTAVFKDLSERDAFMEYSNVRGAMALPLWTLMP